MTRTSRLVMAGVALATVAAIAFPVGGALADQRGAWMQTEVPDSSPTSDSADQVPMDEDDRCPIGVPTLQTATGAVVVTTSPRVAGVAVIIDGERFVTDRNGCLSQSLAYGAHTVELSQDDDGDTLQTIDGSVRPLRSDWDGVVTVGPTPVELTVYVDPAVCALQPPQSGPDTAEPGDDVGLLAISTVPRTPGVLVYVDEVEYFSDPEGCLVLRLPEGQHRITVPDVYEKDETTRFVFGRWDDIWDSERTVSVGGSARELQLGVKIQHPVKLEFFDADLSRLDDARIQTARVVNSFGVVTALSEQATEEDEAISFDEVWLTRNRLRRISAGLFSDDNIYVFREVLVDGTNVVQSGEVDYVPSLSPVCPPLSADEPQRCDTWQVRLLLFPFQVELRSFIFRDLVDGEVAVFPLDGPEDAEPILEGRTSDDGVIAWPQVPRGDYEIRVAAGGITTTSPSIVTGPKVEQITVMTSSALIFLVPVLMLAAITVFLAIVRPRWRLGLAALWPIVIGFVLSVPNLGAAVSRPLSVAAEATYGADGAFVGIDSRVRNGAPVPIEQSYCAPDFELRIPTDNGIWRATFESNDFHDVEMSRSCRIHIVDPGSTRHLFVSTTGQEWALDGSTPPPGVYEAFVRVFGIPAGSLEIDLRSGLAPYLTFTEDVRDEEAEVPFTNPFED